jgi:predicted MPP superfamily phosphohydrolase
MLDPGFLFALLSLLLLATPVARFALRFGPRMATFGGLILAIHFCVTTLLFDVLGHARWALVPLQIVTSVHFLSLARPRLRPRWWRLWIAGPASAFSAGSFLAIPWAIAALLGFDPVVPWLPFVAAGIGAVRSVRLSYEDLDVVLDRTPISELRPVTVGARRTPRPLRIVQITDPHLGTFMSVDRLRMICARAVDRGPDLILLTGDYLTVESNGETDALIHALEPLQAMPGRVFACRGNHDHEAPDRVAQAMEANGIQLLIDQAALVETGAGAVQILGIDHYWARGAPPVRRPEDGPAEPPLGRAQTFDRICAAHPRIPGALRLVLLHDPSAFADLPDGSVDLVLSGHTHGGQVGLLPFGLQWTFLRLFPGIPDHGFWGRGTDRLYVHRGTGHYGFPIRLGVPPEESLLRVHQVWG